MNSLFSMIFGRNSGSELEENVAMVPYQGMLLEEENNRKRSYGDATKHSGAPVPKLVPTPGQEDGGESERPVKRVRSDTRVVSVSRSELEHAAPVEVSAKEDSTLPVDSPLRKLPEDVVAHCLSFLGGVEDRFALQCTSKQFRRISNTEALLRNVAVGGDKQTGLHGIIQDEDTPESASEHLAPYAEAGNLEAIYMLGIIMSYCHQDVKEGLRLLKHAASKGYVRASYALGLALRDTNPEIALKYMAAAADAGYIPALQEVLPPRQMKDKYGEPKADELRLHLDPLCLNRLLTRYYVESAELRDLNTSHCWNPLCGRWAFKANAQPHFYATGQPLLHRNASHVHALHDSADARNGNDPVDVRVSRMKYVDEKVVDALTALVDLQDLTRIIITLNSQNV